MYRTLTRCLCLLVLPLLAIGCSQTKPGDMKQPPRPSELDRLSMFLGNWQGESEVTMKGSDKPMKATGSYTAEWNCDQRFVVAKHTGNMPEMGTMTGIGMWGWDSAEKEYKMWWFDSWGTAGTGEATYDDANRTWTMKWKGQQPGTGKTTYGKGTLKFTDDRTVHEEWKEWDNAFMWGSPTMTMKGTSKKS